eukprot:jgi/Mesen1/1466/ME000132S00405
MCPSRHQPTQQEGLDIFLAVEELHHMSSKDFAKILRSSPTLTLPFTDSSGASVPVDLKKLASCLPLHLLAHVAGEGPCREAMWHLAKGMRLLHTLSELAARFVPLEQVLLQEVSTREQMLDLVIYTLLQLAAPSKVRLSPASSPFG